MFASGPFDIEDPERQAAVQRARDAYLVFARALMERMNGWVQAESQITPRIEGRTVFAAGDEGSGWMWQISEQLTASPMLKPILFKHWNEWRAMPEAMDCARAFVDAGIYALPELHDVEGNVVDDPTQEKRLGAVIDQVAGHTSFALEDRNPSQIYVVHPRTLDLSPDQMLAQYQALLDWRIRPPRTEQVTVPLHNIQSALTEVVTLGSGWSLIPITNEEKTAVWGQRPSLDRPVLDPKLFTQSTCALRASALIREGDESWGRILNNLTAIMTALRLCHAGSFGAFELFSTNDFRALPEWSVPYWMALFVQPCFVLDQADIAAASSIVTQLQRVDVLHGSLAVGLRRFNQSYTRQLPEDRLIDLMIALESSLLHGAEDELTFKLGLRGAALLVGAPDVENIAAGLKEVRLLLETIYGVRSLIVHQGMSLMDIDASNTKRAKDIRKALGKVDANLGIHDLPARTEAVVRNVLKAYLHRLQEVPETDADPLAWINRALDTSMLEGLVALQHASS